MVSKSRRIGNTSNKDPCQEKILDRGLFIAYTMSSQNTLRGMDNGLGCIQTEYAAGFLWTAFDGKSI